MLTRPRDVLAGLIRVVDPVGAVVITGEGQDTRASNIETSSRAELGWNRRRLTVNNATLASFAWPGLDKDAAECFMSPSSHRCTQLSRSAEASPQNHGGTVPIAREASRAGAALRWGDTGHSCQEMQGSGAMRPSPEDTRTAGQRVGDAIKPGPFRHREGSQTGSQPEKTASDSRADGLTLLAAAPVAGSQE